MDPFANVIDSPYDDLHRRTICPAKPKGSDCLLFKWVFTAFWPCRAALVLISFWLVLLSRFPAISQEVYRLLHYEMTTGICDTHVTLAVVQRLWHWGRVETTLAEHIKPDCEAGLHVNYIRRGMWCADKVTPEWSSSVVPYSDIINYIMVKKWCSNVAQDAVYFEL